MKLDYKKLNDFKQEILDQLSKENIMSRIKMGKYPGWTMLLKATS